MKYANQNITTVKHGIVCHGVNCQGVMGSGVAKAIRDKWPSVYNAYKLQPKGKQMLGNCHVICVQDKPELFVANCYTQVYYGRDKKVYASVEAIEESLAHVFELAAMLDLTIHSPRIGCGLGGLRWDGQVRNIYERFVEENSPVEITIYDWNP